MSLWNPLARILGAIFLVACTQESPYDSKFSRKNSAPTKDLHSPPHTADTTSIVPLSPNARTEYEQNSIDIFRKLAPSVVHITTKRTRRGNRQTTVREIGGTGFVWDTKGHIVTNYHVVRGRRASEIRFYDGRTIRADFIGGDKRKDIAVLKIRKKHSLSPVTLPSKRSIVDVGQKAVAIGNPFGFDHTLTIGVISATEREVPGFGKFTISGMLQTDAAINPGNSGGPLLDSRGRLIGMNTMIYANNLGSSSGVGFAVPVSTIRRVVPDIIRYRTVKRPGLGFKPVSDAAARRKGISEGIVIKKIVGKNTPAARAGLRGLRKRNGKFIYDLITRIDKHKITDRDDLYNTLDHYQIGDKVTVHFVRNGINRRVALRLMDLLELPLLEPSHIH